jgi:hypothetical protein
MEDDSLEPANDAHDKRSSCGIWRFLWRGAMGGVLGVFIFFAYAVYRNPYGIMNLVSFLPFLLMAGMSGSLVGTTIWLCNRILGRNLGAVSRVVPGMILTAILIALYLYLTEGVNDDLKGFIRHSLVFGLAVGGLAAAVAKGKKQSEGS